MEKKRENTQNERDSKYLGVGHVRVLVAEHPDLDLQRLVVLFERLFRLAHRPEHIADAAHNIEDQSRVPTRKKKRSYLL